MNERNKAKELFNRGLELYNEKKFESAYKLFAESCKLDYKETTEIYMIRCKKQFQSNTTNKSASNTTNTKPVGDPEKVTTNNY